MSTGLDLAAKEKADQMEAVEELIVKLVNYEAYVMEICIKAAKSLIERNLQPLGHVTQGPDPGAGLGENPAVPLLAAKLYEQVRTSMREGPGGNGQKTPA